MISVSRVRVVLTAGRWLAGAGQSLRPWPRTELVTGAGSGGAWTQPGPGSPRAASQGPPGGALAPERPPRLVPGQWLTSASASERAELPAAVTGHLSVCMNSGLRTQHSVTSDRRMTVETATITAPVPPKKREYSEYPLSLSSISPAMSETEASSMSVKAPMSPAPSSPPQSHAPLKVESLSPSELHAMASKTGPLRSSGFMITDILSGAAQGLPLPLGLPPASLASLHRVPSPHDTASSDAGSYKDNDISDDGEDGEYTLSVMHN